MDSHCRPSRVVYCLITSLAFVSIVPTLWISLVLGIIPPDIAGVYEDWPLDPYRDQEFPNRTIMLDANVVSADILHTTMIVEWTLKYDTCNNDQSQYNCTEVNIFFDVDLSPSDPRYSNGPYNNSITTDPIIIWNGNFSYRFPTVCTELVISTTGPSYLGAYPFDMYFVNIVAYAQDVSTNTTVLLTLTGPYGLINSDLFTQYLWRNHFLHHNILTQQHNEIVVAPIGTVFAFTQLQASMPGAPEGFDFVGLLTA
ncbi:hypothetical protein EDD18DRAFT_1107762 [Armillaria luteobubalina]|uniref:Uncharacterized protein n=1 Tax=Armillaria luteobubalina TaxID=153913 RepID=A0AA39Q097_9AGAR|nr:hypothetical protein EDD18DRAFT_1107762 [Armillaria luteobubalina]